MECYKATQHRNDGGKQETFQVWGQNLSLASSKLFRGRTCKTWLGLRKCLWTSGGLSSLLRKFGSCKVYGTREIGIHYDKHRSTSGWAPRPPTWWGLHQLIWGSGSLQQGLSSESRYLSALCNLTWISEKTVSSENRLGFKWYTIAYQRDYLGEIGLWVLVSLSI